MGKRPAKRPKDRKKFLETISFYTHDLKKDLAIVREALNLLLEGSVGKVTDQQHHFLEIAKRNTYKLAVTIEQFSGVLKKKRLRR
jgi:hypothetical protein